MITPSSNGLRSGGVELRSSNKSSVSLALVLILGTVDSLGDGSGSLERSVACERSQDAVREPGPVDIFGVCRNPVH